LLHKAFEDKFSERKRKCSQDIEIGEMNEICYVIVFNNSCVEPKFMEANQWQTIRNRENSTHPTRPPPGAGSVDSQSPQSPQISG